jgi:hypothetical protein
MLCHDPRISCIRWEMHETQNIALILAHLANKAGDALDWDEIAAAADDCDWPRDHKGHRVTGDWTP